MATTTESKKQDILDDLVDVIDIMYEISNPTIREIALTRARQLLKHLGVTVEELEAYNMGRERGESGR